METMAGAKAYKAVLACHGIAVRQPSADTIHRATVEGGILADYAMIRLLVESKDLWVGIDESSKVNSRSFVEIEFAGSHPKLGFVLYPAAVIEVISHTFENMLGYIENTLAELNQKGEEQGLSAIKLWEFRSITFDLTSSNSGRISGLGHLLNEQRRELWEQESTPKPPFAPLLVKGCDDHIAALILNEFLRRTNKLATEWGAADLLQANVMEDEERVAAAINKSNGVTTALKKLSCLLRGLWNADWMGFVEHAKECNPNLVSHTSRAIPKASKTRYASYALMARFVEDHEELLRRFLETKEGEHAFADEIQTGLFGNSLAVAMRKVLVCGLSQVLLPLMHIGNHHQELLPYLHDFQLLQHHLLALASNPLMLKQCFACPVQSYALPLLSSEVLPTMENFAAKSWVAPRDDGDLQALLAKEFISSALFMLYKHAGQFMEMREEEEEDDWETYSLTPSQVEAVYEAEKQKETEEELQEQEEQQAMMTTDAATIGPAGGEPCRLFMVNRLWRDNCLMRAPIMQAVVKLRALPDLPKFELPALFQRFAAWFKTRTQARNLLDETPSCAEITRTRYEGRLEQQESTRARNQRHQQNDHREKPIQDFLQQRYGFVLPSGKRLTGKHMKDHMRRLKGDYPHLRLCLGNRREEMVMNFLQFLEQLSGQQQQQ
ncbi:hypothetical protein QOT17_005379 [Balamuthia mandrillaris]